MLGWFKKRSRLDTLKARYRELMHKSYEVSLNDPKKSDKIHRQADKIFEEIKYFSLNNGGQ